MRTRLLTLLVALILALVLAPQAEAGVIFSDNFNGHRINLILWNTSIATSGNRWCSSTVADHLSTPGQWLDVSVEPCHNLTQTAPYGAITVGNGEATFCAAPNRTFPYIWRGLPSRLSPFPKTGDFVLEARLKYNSVQPHGSGLAAVAWENTKPTGNNPPRPFGGNVLRIWADSGFGLHFGFLEEPLIYLPEDPLTYHTYRLEYKGGKYSAYVDGVLRAGPICSNVRPNTIWIGNPVFTFWGIFDWSDFTIDYVRVTTPKETVCKCN